MGMLFLLINFGVEKLSFSWVGKPISGLTSGPEVENMPMQKFIRNCIHPQSFIPIGQGISEI